MNNRCLNKIYKKIFSITIIYTILMILFTVSMTMAFSINDSNIIKNTRNSVNILEEEGIYPKLLMDSNKSQLDNFTDAWMLSIAIGSKEQSAIKKAMQCSFKVVELPNDKIDNLKRTLNNEKYNYGEYSRYWHGYQVFIRPMLKFFNYEEIRYLNMFGIIGLFIITIYLIQSKIGVACSIPFAISMLMSVIIIVPMSIQFSSMFYITFLSLIFLMIYNNKLKDRDLTYLLFFVTGAMTSFFDLLTAPILTIGFLIVIYSYLNLKNEKTLKILYDIICKSFLWGLGYIMSWCGKWLIGEFVLGNGVIEKAINQTFTRVSNSTEQSSISDLSAIAKNILLYLEGIDKKLLLCVFIILIILIIFFYKKNTLNMIPTLIVSVYPIICYMILTNHSYIHFWFTYRNLSVSCFTLLSYMIYCIDFEKIKGVLRWNT